MGQGTASSLPLARISGGSTFVNSVSFLVVLFLGMPHSLLENIKVSTSAIHPWSRESVAFQLLILAFK